MAGTTVAFRVHLWDEVVDALASYLEAATQREIVVIADETRGPVAVPARFRKLSHSVEHFVDRGLPAEPEEKTLWWNSDYPLYQLIDELEGDRFLMLEGDVAVRGTIDAMIDRLEADGIEHAAINFGPRTDEIFFYAGTRAYFGEPVYGCVFYAMWLTRDAIVSLRDERLRMKQRLDAGTLEEWLFGEGFVSTHMQREGFRCASINDYVGVTDSDPVDPIPMEVVTAGAAPDGEGHLYHPIVGSPAFERRMIYRLQAELEKARYREAIWRPDNWPFYARRALTALGRRLGRSPARKE